MRIKGIRVVGADQDWNLVHTTVTSMGSDHSKWGRTSSWHLNSSSNTEFSSRWQLEEPSDPNMINHLQSYRLPLFQTQDFLSFCSLEGPQRREQTRAWEQTHLAWTMERGAYTGLAWLPHSESRPWEKLKNHIISGLETDHHVSTNTFQVTMC